MEILRKILHYANPVNLFRKDEGEGRWLYAQGDVAYEAQSVVLTEEEQAELKAKFAAAKEAEKNQK